MFILLDQASVDELVHQAGSIVAHLVIGLHLLDPLLHRVDLGELGLGVGLLFGGRLFVSLDLLESSSPLGGDLEHVGADSLGHC